MAGCRSNTAHEWSSSGLPEIGAKLAEQHISRAKDSLRTGRTTGGRPVEERGAPLRKMLKADVRTGVGCVRGNFVGSLVNALGKPPMRPALRHHLPTPPDSGPPSPAVARFRFDSPSRQAAPVAPYHTSGKKVALSLPCSVRAIPDSTSGFRARSATSMPASRLGRHTC